MNQTKTYKFLATLGFVFSFLVVAQAVSALSWDPPKSSPPADNTPAPIWVGGESQRKSGPLQIDGWFTSAGNTYLASAGGNVGIGTLDPNVKSKLEVAGQISTNRALTHALNVPVTDSADAMLKLYEYAAGNWAGIGVFTNGLPWIRNGLDILNSSGRTMVRVPPTGGIMIGGDGTGNSAAITYGSDTLSLGTYGGKDVNIASKRMMVGTLDATSGTTPDPLGATRLKVNGSVGADYYCDQAGNNCKSITQLGGTGGTGGGGVTSLTGYGMASVSAKTGDISVTVPTFSQGAGIQIGITNQSGVPNYKLSATAASPQLVSVGDGGTGPNAQSSTVTFYCPAGSHIVGGSSECGDAGNPGVWGSLVSAKIVDNGWQVHCEGVRMEPSPGATTWSKTVARSWPACITD